MSGKLAVLFLLAVTAEAGINRKQQLEQHEDMLKEISNMENQIRYRKKIGDKN